MGIKSGTKRPPTLAIHTAERIIRTGNRYGATDPTNALLNYGYALLEAEVRIAALNTGFHLGFGLFHADRSARASFVYDLMEPVRPDSGSISS
jgi:CRISPR/Cas system-associated endonuclease Cas1